MLTAWVDDAPGEEKGDSGGRLGAVKGVDEVLDVVVAAAEPEGATVNDIFQSQERKSFKDARWVTQPFTTVVAQVLVVGQVR